MDPIATLVLMAGEDAILRSPPPPTRNFSPASGADYAPAADVTIPVRGIPEGKIEHGAGATGGFTFSATSKPLGLKADATTLQWRGVTWRVLMWQERTFLGHINGYTLQLAI